MGDNRERVSDRDGLHAHLVFVDCALLGNRAACESLMKVTKPEAAPKRKRTVAASWAHVGKFSWPTQAGVQVEYSAVSDHDIMTHASLIWSAVLEW